MAASPRPASVSLSISDMELPCAPTVPTSAGAVVPPSNAAAVLPSVSSNPEPTDTRLSRPSVWATLLQRTYNPPFLSVSASLVHAQGSLRKFGSKLTTSSLNARHFVLAHHSLQYYKSDPFARPQGTINLAGALLANEASELAVGIKPAPVAGSVWSITAMAEVGGPPRKYVLVSPTPAEKQVWMDLLTASTSAASRGAFQSQAPNDWDSDLNLCVEGWMLKSGSEGPKGGLNRRYFVYMRATHTLSYYKGPSKVAGFVPIETGAVIDVVGKASSSSSPLSAYSSRALAALPPGIDTLSILAYTQSEERCYVLLAANKQERDEWVAALRCALEYAAGGPNARTYDKNKKAAVLSSSVRASSALAALAASSSPASPSSGPPLKPVPSIPTSTSAALSNKQVAAMPLKPPPSKPLPQLGAAASGAKPPNPASPTPASPTQAPPPRPAAASPPPEGSDEDAEPVDDEWALPGRAKGESVSYVNLTQQSGSPQPPGRRVPPKPLVQVPEAVSESEEEDDASSLASPSSAALSPSSPAQPSAPSRNGNLAMVERSVLELYSTEATYVTSLRVICTQYLLRFRKHLELELEPRWFEPHEYAQLAPFFQHVETIRDINGRLLKELEVILSDAPTLATIVAPTTSNTPMPPTPSSTIGSPSSFSSPTVASSASPATPSGSRVLSSLGRIAATLKRFIPFFKVYTLFAQSYDETLKLLDALADRRAPLKSFLSLTDACEGTTLASLMITPIQRVGRYVLLLETIIRSTPVGFDGSEDLEKALSEMRAVGALINTTVALWEAKSRVVELQARIDCSILAPGRFLVREGVLGKTYSRSGKTAGFFSKKSDSFVFLLFNDSLVQCKKSAVSERLAHRATMPLQEMLIEDLPDTIELKAAWSITYTTPGGGGSSSTPTVRATVCEPEAALEISPLSSLRPPSISMAPPSPSAVAAAAAVVTPPVDDDRKSLTLFAANAEEKSRWIVDILQLIEQQRQKNRTLMRAS